MKNKLLKSVLVLICITAMILGSVMIVQAEEMKEVITGEHNITISPQKQNTGYVYVNAQVPKGWGGEIRVNFHSRTTGKDHSCSMSYLENEYHSGLWLPAGTYQVTAELPQDDGLCQLTLQDPTQEVIQVKSGDNLYLNILASEISDESPATESTSAPVIPPKAQEDYQDLPTANEDTPESTESTEALDIEEVPEDGNLLTHVVRILAVILVVIVVILSLVYWIQNRSDADSD